MKPPSYYRQNQNWSAWIGRQGIVIASTMVRVAASERSGLTPYCYVIVDFGNEKKEFMGTGHDLLEIGDKVTCVLRKTTQSDSASIIEYGIKVTKI